MTKRHSEDTVLRQSLANRASHWLIALSTFVLVFTGLGQMPMAARGADSHGLPCVQG